MTEDMESRLKEVYTMIDRGPHKFPRLCDTVFTHLINIADKYNIDIERLKLDFIDMYDVLEKTDWHDY